MAAFDTQPNKYNKVPFEYLHFSAEQPQLSPVLLLAKWHSTDLVFAVVCKFNYSSHSNCRLLIQMKYSILLVVVLTVIPFEVCSKEGLYK